MSSLFSKHLSCLLQKNPPVLEFAARDFASSLANTYIAALLIEHAVM
jgi:hypothetical protein